MNINEFKKHVTAVAGQQVLLMLSGGKDSSACLIILRELGIRVTAIHFNHKWSSQVSTNEARRLCAELQVQLIEIDFTEDFYHSIKGFEGGRPCLICKPLMYQYINKELQTGKYKWICIGDNANDTTTIARLTTYIADKPNENKYCSTYFGSEQGVVLPDAVKVLRPILNLDAHAVELYLESRGVSIAKNNSTGDKYFEYAREGCPVQYHDPGFPIKSSTLDDLQKYNTLLGLFAKKKDIRASIHLPSSFIVTIPTGFELEAAQFLEAHGLSIDKDINGFSTDTKAIVSAEVHITNTRIFSSYIYKKLYGRFLERMQYTVKESENLEGSSLLIDSYTCVESQVHFTFFKTNSTLLIHLATTRKPSIKLVENLIIEIFRTRKFKLIQES